MEDTPATAESTSEIAMNNLPTMPDLTYFLNFYAGDIAAESVYEFCKAVENNIPLDEQMRLCQPENREELFSAIRSLPEFKAIMKQAKKRIKKRFNAVMESTTNNNPGCHSTQ